MEQRYHAVLEVVSGAPVTEVARRYGVSRQAVHGWLGRYDREGLAGLADHSHRPAHQPRQLDAEIEALICQLRRTHPRWGPRRLLFELGRARVSPLPSRSTIYRVLVRHGLVPARKRKRRRQDYKRWQREEPMQLWQMDVTGSVFLADGQLMHVITQDGVLWRTLPCPIPPGQRHRLQGVRLAGPAPLPDAASAVQRRVSSRGGIQVARQRIQVGMTHAGKIVTVATENNSFRLVIDGETVAVVPRTTGREIDRYKAYATHPGRR